MSERKIDRLRALMVAEDWPAALSLAAKFPRLGEHEERITRGDAACKRPDFYRQIKRDPAALVADGIAALRERYDG